MGAEELSRMVEANSALKLLLVLDRNHITASPIISAALARNRAMEIHIWSKVVEGDRSPSKVVELIPEASTLRIYRLNSSGCQRVACALGFNTTVKTLDMTGIRLKAEWAKEFRGSLEQNRILREVILSRTCLEDKAVVYVAAGLFKNKCLESLQLDGNWFGGTGVEHLLCPLSRFSPFQNQANTTLKLLTFGGGKTKIGRDGLAAILGMLETNQTIVQLGIHNDTSMKPADTAKIFRSLQRNATLRHLSLKGCRGVDGESVLQTILETLQVNPWIEDIDLQGTPLQIAGKTSTIYEKLKRQNGGLQVQESGSLVGDDQLPMEMPASCRVFLCGQEFAGKDTLCSSICHNLSSTKLPYMDQIRTLVNQVEQIAETDQRMKIKTVHDGGTKITIWNLAGQHENFALHELMFPGHGSPLFFLIVCSLFRKPANREAKSSEEIEDDILYWLRFIVSNSRRTNNLQPIMVPHVTIVLTHVDKVTRSAENLGQTVRTIQRLRERFQGLVELYQTVFSVNARSSVSVSRLTHHLRKTSKTILQRVPQVYRLCNELMKILEDWRSQNNNKPAMAWSEFCQLCQLKVPALRIQSRSDNMQLVEMRRRRVVKSLHHVGEIIFFEELGFLILDCNWFCGEVLGQLMRLNQDKDNVSRKVVDGFVSRKQLERILTSETQIESKLSNNLASRDIIKMMLKLELCYEQDPQDPDTLILIPALLEEGRRKPQRWKLSTPGCVYVGRHLECDDLRHTFLTAGFFSRLQVRLHNKIIGLKDQQGAAYSLEKSLISIVINGIEWRVELGAQHGNHIDILACSATKSVSEILRFYRHLIVPTIQSLSPSIVATTESIIRPDCVKNLIPPRLRRSQVVPLEKLKQALLSMPADSMYDYQHTWSPVFDGSKRPLSLVLPPGFDYARDLLSDEDVREVLHQRYYDLQHLATELAAVPEEAGDEAVAGVKADDERVNNVEPSLSGIAKGVEAVLRRLSIIEEEMRDLKQEIQGLRQYEQRLVLELHRKVDYLMNYNLQLEERKVPRLFYLVQAAGGAGGTDYSTTATTKRLVTRIFPGMTALRLQMLCEYRGEMHVVEDQAGCEVVQVDNEAVKSLLPYLSKLMKLFTFALKIGAHVAVGMGEMIPDLGREVAHLLVGSSSLVYGAEAIAAGAVGAAAMGRFAAERRGRNNSSSRTTGSGEMAGDMASARQWLVDFLRGQRVTTGKDIADRFGLWRVRYVDDGNIAWVCRRHKEARANEIIELPL